LFLRRFGAYGNPLSLSIAYGKKDATGNMSIMLLTMEIIGSILAALALVYVSKANGSFYEMNIDEGIKGTVISNPAPLIRNIGNCIFNSRFYYGDYALYVGMMCTIFLTTLATGVSALYLRFKKGHSRTIDFMIKMLIIYVGLFVNAYSSNIVRFLGGSIVSDIYGNFND
jgi:hypothetical protein